MPLCNVKFPANAELFNGYMIEIAGFDILPTEFLLDKIMYFPEEDPLNLNFEILEYGSSYAIPNLGTIFFMLAILVILVPINGCLFLSSGSSKEIRKQHENLTKFLFWKGSVRIMIESYLEILLATSINFAMYNRETEYVGVTISNVVTIVLFVTAVGLPVWVVIFFLFNIKKWGQDEFEEKHGSVLEGSRLWYNNKEQGKTWIAIVHPVLMLLRRIGFVFTVVFQPEFTWLQLAVTFMFIQMMWNFIIYFYPMADNFSNRMEIFAEITNMMLMYHVFMFTDFVGEPTMRYSIGFSFTACMAIFISVHLFIMIRSIFKSIRNSLRRRHKKKLDKQAKEQKRVEQMDKFKRKIARIQDQGDDVDDIFEDFGIEMGTDVGKWALDDYDKMNAQIAHNKEVRERKQA